MGHGPEPEHPGRHVDQVGRSVLWSLLRRSRDGLMIMPYRGFGTPARVSLCGRVLEDEGFAPAAESDRRWHNLASFFKRMESDEVPRARVLARLGGVEQEVIADEEGYFHVEFHSSTQLERGTWHAVELELAEHPGIRATGEVLVPAQTSLGVISDIDDTILESNVTRKLRMLLTVALSNARTRKPFAGVAAFYRALVEAGNPIFYVSKSPWNLYALIVEFMELQGIPRGPLMLRDFGWRKGRENHKEARIEALLETYPMLKFVLIGDSGEQDPETYSAIVRAHPQRIRVIYIRSVDPAPSRLAAVAQLAQEVAKTGCQLVLVPDSELAAAHAAGEGLITPAALEAVRLEKNADRKAPRIPAPPATG